MTQVRARMTVKHLFRLRCRAHQELHIRATEIVSLHMSGTGADSNAVWKFWSKRILTKPDRYALHDPDS